MNLLGVEDRVLDRSLASVDPADADGTRRHPPFRRDQFDNFIFEATRWVVGEADIASFGYACQRYRYANNDNDMTALLRPVPLIPPAVTITVADYVAQCDRPRDGEPRVDGKWFTEREAGLRDQLYQAIGGDRGDGPKAAGLRAYSHMWSARIGEGLVHPAIGGHIWGSVLLRRRRPSPRPLRRPAHRRHRNRRDACEAMAGRTTETSHHRTRDHGPGPQPRMVNQSEIYLVEVERKVVTRHSRQVAPEAAKALRRHAPLRRDSFDSFIFEATQWARDDGAAASFSFACEHLKADRHEDAADVDESVPRVPLAVAGHVDRIVSRWRRVPQAPWAINLPDEEAQLRDELYLSLGGDFGDGLAAAGYRLYSRMWAARIADGFVHPAVGAYMWNDNSGSYGDDRADDGGPLIAALHTAGEMWGRWWNEPDHRPDIEQEITDFARTLGW